MPPRVPLVVAEGNYLLEDRPPWTRVRELLDEVWFLALDEGSGTDQRNAELVAAGRDRADLVVRLVASRAPAAPEP